MFDQTGGVEEVHTDTIAWHCGNGNNTSVGYEHAGYAAFTRAEWTTDAGLAMLHASAKTTAKVAKALGIPGRWLSVAEVADNVQGFCTHNDMRLARGGTTHTDPGPNFPYDLYMQYVTAAMTGGSTTPPQQGDVLDMDAKELSDLIDQRLKVALGNDYAGAPLQKVVAAGPPSSRAASKVRDMAGGTGGLAGHALTQGEKLQALLDHFEIKLP